MTPKEKAEELFWKYTKVSNFSAVLDFDGNTHIDLEFGISKVKECALIAVDEIIEALYQHHWQNRNVTEYYREVKQEINNL
jgi:hypothetical protein